MRPGFNRVKLPGFIVAACFAGVAVGAVGGHALEPRDLASASTPTATSTPDLRSPKTPAPTDRYAPSRAWQASGPMDQLDAYSAMVKEVGSNQTCLRDVAHSYRGVYANDDKAHQDLPSTTHKGMHYEFGGYVKGVCDGLGANLHWHYVGQELRDVLAEGGGKNDDTYPWEKCLTNNDGEADLVICPDGRYEAL